MLRNTSKASKGFRDHQYVLGIILLTEDSAWVELSPNWITASGMNVSQDFKLNSPDFPTFEEITKCKTERCTSNHHDPIA